MTDETIPAIDDVESLENNEPKFEREFSPAKHEISINELRANTRKYCRRFSEEVDQE